MTTAQRHAEGMGNRPVLVSNTAVNMISSLHPFDKTKVEATLGAVKSSVHDPAKIKRIVGVENAFVARVGNLRVVFRTEDDKVLITSVVKKADV